MAANKVSAKESWVLVFREIISWNRIITSTLHLGGAITPVSTKESWVLVSREIAS